MGWLASLLKSVIPSTQPNDISRYLSTHKMSVKKPKKQGGLTRPTVSTPHYMVKLNRYGNVAGTPTSSTDVKIAQALGNPGGATLSTPSRDWSNPANWGFEREGHWFQTPADYNRWKQQQSNRPSQEQVNQLKSAFMSALKSLALRTPVYASDNQTQQPPTMGTGFLDKLRQGVGQGVANISSFMKYGNNPGNLSGLANIRPNTPTIRIGGKSLSDVIAGKDVIGFMDVYAADRGSAPDYSSQETSANQGPNFSQGYDFLGNKIGYNFGNTKPSRVSSVEEQLKRDVNNYNITPSNTGNGQGNGQEDNGEWALINDQIDQGSQSKLQEILSLYQQGAISQEEALRKQQEILKQNAIAKYDFLNKKLEEKIPTLQDYYSTLINRIRHNLQTTEQRAEPIQTDIKESYADRIRQLGQQSVRSQNQLRNIYSALGSVESSQFLNRLANINKERTRGEISYTKDENKRLENIRNQLEDYRTQAKDKITDLEKERDTKIQDIKDRQDLNDFQKLEEIQNIVEETNSKLAAINQNLANKEAQLKLIDYQALQTQRGIVSQGAVQSNLLNQQYALEKNMMNQIPQPDNYESMIQYYTSGGSQNPPPVGYKDWIDYWGQAYVKLKNTNPDLAEKIHRFLYSSING